MPFILYPLPSAGFLDDLHSFDPATMTWTLLSAANDTRRPSARSGHGFTSAGGLLYVHGGFVFSVGDGDAVGRAQGRVAYAVENSVGGSGCVGEVWCVECHLNTEK